MYLNTEFCVLWLVKQPVFIRLYSLAEWWCLWGLPSRSNTKMSFILNFIFFLIFKSKIILKQLFTPATANMMNIYLNYFWENIHSYSLHLRWIIVKSKEEAIYWFPRWQPHLMESYNTFTMSSLCDRMLHYILHSEQDKK